MTDLAGDTGNQAMSVAVKSTEKVAELLFKLLQYIFNTKKRWAEKSLTYQRLLEVKTAQNQHKALQELNGVFGIVEHQRMKDTGKEMDTVGVTMTKDELTRFSEYAKREGLTFAALEDSREGDNEQFFVLHIFKDDFLKAKGITEKVALDSKIMEIDDAINNLKSKGELSEQDKFDIQKLEEQREALRHSLTQQFNKEQNQGTFEESVNGITARKSDFNSALDRYTGIISDGSTKYPQKFICERTNPANFIQCDSSNYLFHGKRKILTEYTVFKDNKEVYKGNDKFFEGRPQYYWPTVKSEIKLSADFSNDLLIFENKEDLQKYAVLFAEQQKELDGMEQSEGRNYDAINTNLNEQLDRNGAMLNEQGIVVDKNSGEPLKLNDALAEDKNAAIAESIVIGKQINNYDNLARLETDIAIQQSTLNDTVSEKGDTSPEAVAEKTKLDSLQTDYQAALKEESHLKDKRAEINGAQAQEQVESEYGVDINHEQGDIDHTEIDPDKADTMDAWSDKITEQRQQTVNDVPDLNEFTKSDRPTEIER